MGLASLNAVGIPSRPGGIPTARRHWIRRGFTKKGRDKRLVVQFCLQLFGGYVLLVGLSKTSRQKIVFLRVKIKVFFFFPKEIIYPEILDPCF